MSEDDNHNDDGHSHDEHSHDGHSHESANGTHEDESHDHDQPGTHDHHSHDQDHLGVAVLTVSSSRSLDDDAGGDRIVDALENAGHEVATRDLVPDDYDTIQSSVERFIDRDDVDIVVTTGGTGVTPDDVTVEAVRPLVKKELPGFGELFRQRSYEEIGTMIVATRTTAGIADGVPVFCLPGSENAATLGAELIVSSAGHLTGLASRDDHGDGHSHDHGDEHDHGESTDEHGDTAENAEN